MPPQYITTSIRTYSPALLMDEVASRDLRRKIGSLFFFVALIAGALVLIGIFLTPRAVLPFETSPYIQPLIGLFCVSSSLWLLFSLIAAFYNSHYFRDVRNVIREAGRGSVPPVSYTLAKILFHTDPKDTTLGFFRSSFGTRLLMRLGISAQTAREYLDAPTYPISLESLDIPDDDTIQMPAFAKALFAKDQGLQKFLFKQEIQEADFLGAVEWRTNVEERRKRKERWWSRDNLGRIPGLGSSFAYGQTGHLERYAEELTGGSAPTETGVIQEVESLETALTKSESANALIVADTGSGEMDVIYGLVGMIERGTAFPALEGVRVFKLDALSLINSAADRAEFENEFIQVMNQAVRAGNVIIVFDDLPGFVKAAENIGSDVGPLLGPYLKSSAAQIIAVSDKTRFHEVIERRPALVNGFEIVRVKEKDATALIGVLESLIPAVEEKTDVFFTYQAIKAIAESAARFFTESAPLDKAHDLLLEVSTRVRNQGRMQILKDDVMALVESKTGVPQEGRMGANEQDKLLNLETLLHERVVGQNEAISAVANAMRRARAGLRNQNRPIGSFLFLGPTGVGKTETAKALGDVFFSADTPMLRLDMSEYSGGDALSRLIGSAQGNAGVFASMLRDQKYGVLLLDEFEKTTPEVMNLFLQVLDEGIFTDAEGKKVNARNLIIIATSNAGAEDIVRFVESGQDLTQAKDAFTNLLIERRLFRPELLNRFDGVILFHPLAQDHLKEIAVLSVQKLAEQLKTQGIQLVSSDDLLQYLAAHGFDPKFGARSMNRVLQEKVEKLIADKMIRGEIARGATIALMRSPANPDELEIRSS